MISFHLKRIAIALCVVALPFVHASRADLVVKDGAGNSQTIFDFTCFTTKHCTAHVNINSAGTEIFDATTPGFVSVRQGGNTAVVTASGADGVSNTLGGQQAYARLQMFNGTTWDRLIGDTTNGVWVNVRTSTGPAQGSATSGQTGSLVMGAVTTNAPSYTTAQTSPLSVDTGGRMRVQLNADPCLTTVATSAPISITSATTTRIVAPSASNRTYVCYLYLQTGAANNIAVVEGTGGTCGAGTAGIVGGTTAANGLNNAANSGQQFQDGGRTAIATAGTNVDLCLITSSVGPLAGHIRYVQAP